MMMKWMKILESIPDSMDDDDLEQSEITRASFTYFKY